MQRRRGRKETDGEGIMGIEERLKSWKRKTISRNELGKLLGAVSDEDLYRLFSSALSEGLLSPVKASGTDGNRVHPIFLKYRIKVQEDFSVELSEIALLHPWITRTGYLSSRPDLYRKYRDQIQRLNSYLFGKEPGVYVSRRERSFEIFDQDKELDDESFRGFLDRLGLTDRVLHYYETPSYCFNDYIPERKEDMTLLICENKDIWFNIRRRMYEDRADALFNILLDGVIWGGGNNVSKAGALSAYTRFLRVDRVRYLYWGDIDREGLNIYLSLKRSNPGLDIRLFEPAYEEMLRLAAGRSIPDSDDHRERVGDYSGIYQIFPENVREALEKSIEENKRIPQEIISYEKLLEVMR